jgi:hypothetical protein
VVVLPSLDAPADPVDRLTARLATLTRERTQRVDELRAMAPDDRQALVRERVAALLDRDDDDALERLATLTREV